MRIYEHTHTHTHACMRRHVLYLTKGSCWQAYVSQIMTSDTAQRTSCLRTESAARLADDTHIRTHITGAHLLSNSLQLQTTDPSCNILVSGPADKHDFSFKSTEGKDAAFFVFLLFVSLGATANTDVHISLIISFQSFIKSGTPLVH